MQFVAYHTLMAHRIAGSGPALALVLATLALAWGCAAAPRRGQIPIGDVESGPGSLTATRKALEGTWTLDSLEVIDAAGVRRPVKSHGRLTVDPEEMNVLEWDAENLRFKNNEDANALLRRTYRKGWEVSPA